jgi:hypothetical protein
MAVNIYVFGLGVGFGFRLIDGGILKIEFGSIL